MQRTHSIAVAIALACAAPVALAQAPGHSPEDPQSGMDTHTPPFNPPPHSSAATANPALKAMPPRAPQTPVATTTTQGQHDVEGTVQYVSSKGVVELKTADGVVKLPFPDAKDSLHKGQKITVHLSYTVEASSSAVAAGH